MRYTFYLALLSVLWFPTEPVFAQGGIDKPQYQILTHRAGSFLGTFTIELFPLIAPLHVQNFDSLANDQFYDSTAFHRVVPGFVIQGGDPNSINGPISTWGYGQPWQVTVPAEFNVVRHLRGRLGAARDNDPNSATSQFYICVANSTFLDGNYTVYGQVTGGMNIVDTIVSSPRDANDVPFQKIEMFVTYTGVNDSVPDAPTLNLPADGASGVLNTQSFTWSIVPGAVMYTIELSTDASFSVIDISRNAGANSSTVPELQGSTQYYWRVKSNNGGHESAYSNVHVLNSASAAPVLIYPADSANAIPLSLEFAWNDVSGADSYTLQVSTSSTFTTQSMIYNTAGLTDTTQIVSGLNPFTLYYWRVRSANGTTQGFYSAKYSFTTGNSTGISENNSGINISSVYPNPAQSVITVSGYVKHAGSMKITINDKLGKVIYDNEIMISQNNFSHTIPVSKYTAGIYFITLQKDGSRVVRKIAVH